MVRQAGSTVGVPLRCSDAHNRPIGEEVELKQSAILQTTDVHPQNKVPHYSSSSVAGVQQELRTQPSRVKAHTKNHVLK